MLIFATFLIVFRKFCGLNLVLNNVRIFTHFLIKGSYIVVTRTTEREREREIGVALKIEVYYCILRNITQLYEISLLYNKMCV